MDYRLATPFQIYRADEHSLLQMRLLRSAEDKRNRNESADTTMGENEEKRRIKSAGETS